MLSVQEPLALFVADVSTTMNLPVTLKLCATTIGLPVLPHDQILTVGEDGRKMPWYTYNAPVYPDGV